MTAAQCGLSLDAFWEMTWHDFTIYRTAYERREIAEWARTRRIAYMVYVMNSADKTRKSEQEFHALPIDEPQDRGRPLDIGEIQDMLKLYSRPEIKN